MKRFVEGEDRNQSTLLPECLEDYITEDNHRIQDHPGELVRGTVEETLNTMLDAEADALCGAQYYETQSRSGGYPGRQL